jgi:hypothetical protein
MGTSIRGATYGTIILQVFSTLAASALLLSGDPMIESKAKFEVGPNCVASAAGLNKRSSNLKSPTKRAYSSLLNEKNLAILEITNENKILKNMIETYVKPKAQHVTVQLALLSKFGKSLISPFKSYEKYLVVKKSTQARKTIKN